MNPAVLLLSSTVATLRSGFCSLLGIIIISFSFHTNLKAQTDSLKLDSTSYDEVKDIELKSSFFSEDAKYINLTSQQQKKRIWLVAGGNVVAYSGTMIGLSSAWYKNYPRSGFHSFNDNKEWLDRKSVV